MTCLKGKNPHIRVFFQAHIQYFKGQVGVVSFIDSNQRAHLVRIHIFWVKLSDDRKNMFKIVKPVGDIEGAVVLDSPDIDQISHE